MCVLLGMGWDGLDWSVWPEMVLRLRNETFAPYAYDSAQIRLIVWCEDL